MSVRKRLCAPVRTVKSTSSIANDKQILIELDSHADTCVVGSSTLVVHDHERLVDIYGFDHSQSHKDARTVDVAVAYDDPRSGLTSILMINQAILVDSLQNVLLCPMQCHVHGTDIDECPKFLSKIPTDQSHSLTVFDPKDRSPPLLIPFS